MRGSALFKLAASSPFRFFRRPPPIANRDALGQFWSGRAAFVAQKSSVEYCRARAGVNSTKLFKEVAFRDALDICRWESFAAVLADFALMLETYLRPWAAGSELPLADRLLALHREILLSYPVPAHRQSWADLVDELPPRLAAAQLAPPQPPDRIGLTSAMRVFEVLPIHPRLRGHDREMVINSVRFLLVSANDELRRLGQPEAILADLIGEP